MARLVAQLFRAETKLQKVLDTQTKDASVIRRALKKAEDAGLKPENSDIVLAAYELLDQVHALGCWGVLLILTDVSTN